MIDDEIAIGGIHAARREHRIAVYTTQGGVVGVRAAARRVQRGIIIDRVVVKRVERVRARHVRSVERATAAVGDDTIAVCV